MSQESFEATGRAAVSTIKAALSGMDLDTKEVERVYVEVDTIDPDPSPLPEPEEPDANGSGRSVTGRSLGGIQKDTNHHYTLALLAAIGDPTPAESLIEFAPEGTLDRKQLANATYALHDRMLVDRDSIEGSPGYRYYINKHGEAELQRLGEPELDTGDHS